MSATGRGAERQKDDFYETPAWCVRRYLDKREEDWGYKTREFYPWRWLEPSAGRGAIIRAVKGWCAGSFGPAWTAVELNMDFAPAIGYPCLFGADFLDPRVTTDKKYDLCIGNPPFKLAREFIEKGLEVSCEVAFLLRLNFLEGAKRAEFFKKHPCDVHVLPNRPSFTPDGHTDATAYAWFEFGEGHDGRVTVLATTPKAERLADRVKAI